MFDGLNRLRLRLRAFFHRRRLEKDLEDEFAFHRAMREEALRRPLVRDLAPGVPLYANLGAIQLCYGLDIGACRRALTFQRRMPISRV